MSFPSVFLQEKNFFDEFYSLLLLQHPSTDTTLKDLEGYTAFDLYNSTVEGTKPELFLSPATSTLSPVQSVAGAELFTWGANRFVQHFLFALNLSCFVEMLL